MIITTANKGIYLVKKIETNKNKLNLDVKAV